MIHLTQKEQTRIINVALSATKFQASLKDEVFMLNMLVASGLCRSIFIGDGVFLPLGVVYLQ